MSFWIWNILWFAGGFAVCWFFGEKVREFFVDARTEAQRLERKAREFRARF